MPAWHARFRLSAESDDGERQPIRLLTLNAHQGFNALRRRQALPRIREALRSSGADLVFLQEIGVAAGSETPVSQYELLADTVWPQHAYGRNAVVTGGHHGNALLSKFPIARWQNVDISVGRAERRGMLHCVVDVTPASPALHAVCLHLALRESHRRYQVGRLLEFIAAEVPQDSPLVVAGDFNDWRGRAHARLSQPGLLEEINASATGQPARTFPASYPILRLDRIYVRNLRHRPLSLPQWPWSKLSDHVPLGGVVEPQGTAA
jgi:endonuclease/exonuclease/phosphatase family metal-dependent hydrolase